MTDAITLKPVGRVNNQIKEPLMFSHENGLELREELSAFWEKVAEMKQLTSEVWRVRMADSVTAAIDGYFTKRIARVPF